MLTRIAVAFGALLAAPSLDAQTQPVKTTLAQFKQLHCIGGQWRGSGGAYPAFFEEYRVVDDSTILMRAFPNSTFKAAKDSSVIELRGGVVQSRSMRSVYSAVELTASKVRFLRQGATSGGHTFQKVSADEWTATLHASTPTGAATVYRMRRVGPAQPRRP